MSCKKINAVFIALALSACAGPAKYDYVKKGASEYQKAEALSSCQYKIKLQRTPAPEQAELRNACMEDRGFHYKVVAE